MHPRPFTVYTLARAGEHSLIDIGGEAGSPAFAVDYLRCVTSSGDVAIVAPNDLSPRVLAAGLVELARHLEDGHAVPCSAPLPSLHTRS